MGRILFFVLIGVAAYVAFRIWRSGPRGNAGPLGRSPDGGSEAMIRCAHCGLNVPRSEATTEAGLWYCSDGHRQLGRGGA